MHVTGRTGLKCSDFSAEQGLTNLGAHTCRKAIVVVLLNSGKLNRKEVRGGLGPSSIVVSNRSRICKSSAGHTKKLTKEVFGRPFVKRFALCYRTVLSVTLVYCGHTVGRIKMPLGMEVYRPRFR